MHFLRFLFSLFYILHCTCSARTLLPLEPEYLTITPLKNTSINSTLEGNKHNNSRNLPKTKDMLHKTDFEILQKTIEEKSKLSNEELLDKIFDLIIENRVIKVDKCQVDKNYNKDNDLRNSNLNKFITTVDLAKDYYDSIDSFETRRLPVSLETPKNGLLGRLHFKFDPIKNYEGQNKKRGRYENVQYMF